MGILADELYATIARLQELDERQTEQTQRLITSVDNLLEGLPDTEED